ncbi:MAG TPA: hypothetical protein DCM87_11600 [Planctomycetes bacterium]|nr:hypothetical protein [Planctomycetota bacterium]
MRALCARGTLAAALCMCAAAVHGQGSAQIRLSLVRGAQDSAIAVRFDSLPAATARLVQGWSYGVCIQDGIEVVEAVAGADLAAAGATAVAIDRVAGGITVRVTLTGDLARGLPENGFAAWEDLVIRYRCVPGACMGGMASFCRDPIGGLAVPAEFSVGGVSLSPERGVAFGACGPSGKVRVDPVYTYEGRVAVVLRADPDVAACPLQGWSYGVCINGDIQVGAMLAGADTIDAKGGVRPDWDMYKLSERGIARSVIIDVIGPIVVGTDRLIDGWEDFVFSVEGMPCGTIRICDEEVGDPPVDATWTYKEEGLPMGAANLGARALCWQRGDTNFDGKLNIADAINLLACLFGAGGGPYCACAQAGCRPVFNANNDDRLNIADPIYLLQYIFLNGPPPPPLR